MQSQSHDRPTIWTDCKYSNMDELQREVHLAKDSSKDQVYRLERLRYCTILCYYRHHQPTTVLLVDDFASSLFFSLTLA
jgi:hypothetical protein